MAPRTRIGDLPVAAQPVPQDLKPRHGAGFMSVGCDRPGGKAAVRAGQGDGWARGVNGWPSPRG